MFGITKTAHAGLIFKAPSSIGLIQGLVGYWSFDGPDMAGDVGYDRSGNARNGTSTIVNPPSEMPRRTIGRIGQALEFNYIGGTNGIFRVAGQAFMPTGDFTYSIWEKILKHGGNGNQTLFSGETGAIDMLRLKHVGILPANTDFQISINNNFYTSSGVYPNYVGSWHHIILSRQGSDVRLYVDGKKDPSTITDGATLSFQSDCYFVVASRGCDGGGGQAYRGSLDDVRIYNRALSEGEILRLYKMGATLKINQPKYTGSLTDGLVGYWSFDGNDMAGTVAYDRSVQGNNGTLTNGPTRTIGKIGQAMNFIVKGATFTHIEVSDPTNGSLDFGTGDFSYSVWFKSDGKTNSDGTYQILMKFNEGNYELQYNTGEALLANVEAGVDQTHIYGTTIIKPDIWYNAVFVRKSGFGYLYVNNKLENSAAAAQNVDSSTSLFIGSGGTNEQFSGIIDDVRIYNRALSPEEVSRLYRIGGTIKINQSISNDSLKNGLVSWITFDGNHTSSGGNVKTFTDVSGSGNYATTTNSSFVPGKIGQALSFNGSTRKSVKIVTGATTLFSPDWNTTSMSVWIKPTSASVSGANPCDTTPIIMDHNDADTDACAHSILRGISTNWGSIDRIWLMFYDSGCCGKAIGIPYAKDVWQHIAFVHTGGVLYGYLNGVLATSTLTDSHVAIGDNYKFYIGGNNPNAATSNQFNGQIDDVRMYNRALSREEVQRLYNMGR